jgi:DNA adenine methylase
MAHGFTTPLRYPGGKGALSNFMKLVIVENGLLDGHYVEPYAGGAGIAWPLLFEEYIQHVHINDLSSPIYAFWKSVLEDTDKLVQMIRDVSVTMPEWRRQKAIQLNPRDYSHLELGFSTLFLNRTNRSGIITGGVIGGKRQEGIWKLGVRFNKQDLIARIERIARYSNRISLNNCDACEFLSAILPTLPAKTLVYLDPPYYKKGADLYQNFYGPKDHVKVARFVTETIKQPWIVSYDAVPAIVRHYAGFKRIRYGLSYSAQDRYTGSEIIFFSKNLVPPQITDPSKTGQKEINSAAQLELVI